MRWRSFVGAGLVIVTIASSTLSQSPAPEHRINPPHVPKITYKIRADVVPESLLVRGQMELEYHNLSDDTLSEAYFYLDMNAHRPLGYCLIDSILYYGAPLSEDEVAVDKSLMKVSLPVKLTPQATGFFLIAFESGVAPLHLPSFDKRDHIEFSNWYPCVCPYQDGRWYSDSSLSRTGEYALYNVALRIDSSYSIAHSGRLLNEKELYGLLPRGTDDTMYIDIVNKHSFTPGGVRYHPEFPSGYKRYFIRAQNATGFSFVVGPEFSRDRSYRNGLTIEVCYDKKAQKIWEGFVARSSVDLIKQYEKWLGKFPRKNLTIVAGEGLSGNHSSEQLIILPSQIRDTSLLYTALAIGLASCWFSPTLPDSNGVGQWFDEGLTYYAAIRVLYDCFGAAGYEMIRQYEKEVSKLSNCKKWSRQFMKKVFHEIPSHIHALSFILGDKILFNVLQEYVKLFRYEFPGASDFYAIVEKSSGMSLSTNFNEWVAGYSVFDLGVSTMKTKPADDGYDVSYKVSNHGSIAIPVEIGYVISTTDTVYDTLQYDQLPGRSASSIFHKTISTRPKAVVLDPNHYLPDIDRSNNYSFTLPVRFRYRPPETLFPPFENLR